MTAPALIGPAAPTDHQFALMQQKRDAYARVISRDVARGFQPSAFYTETFALLDGAVTTAVAILKACR